MRPSVYASGRAARRPPAPGPPRHAARGVADLVRISSALPLGTLRRSRRPHQRARTADHIIEETGPRYLTRAGTLHAGARYLAALIPVRLFPRAVRACELAVPMPSSVSVHPLKDAAVAEGVPDDRANQRHSDGAHQSQSEALRRSPSEPIRGTQTEPIRAHQRHSDGAHQSQSKALRRSPSEPIKGASPKTYLPFPCQSEPIRANQSQSRLTCPFRA